MATEPREQPIKVVWFDETNESRDVIALCGICKTTAEDVRANEFLVSPQGVAHRQNEDIIENTVCGHDATAPDWWWPL